MCIATVCLSVYPEIPPDDHCNSRHKKVGSQLLVSNIHFCSQCINILLVPILLSSHWLLLGVQGYSSELYGNRSVIKGCCWIACFTVVLSITRFAIAAITSHKVYAGCPVLAWIVRALVDVWNMNSVYTAVLKFSLFRSSNRTSQNGDIVFSSIVFSIPTLVYSVSKVMPFCNLGFWRSRHRSRREAIRWAICSKNSWSQQN